jgi:hypothetical protein
MTWVIGGTTSMSGAADAEAKGNAVSAEQDKPITVGCGCDAKRRSNMKKIVGGKRYDTETAAQVGSWSNNLPASDFGTCEESLYRTQRGAYFLHGKGGGLTCYARSVGGNSHCAGEDVIALEPEEALAWLESHWLDVPDGCPEIAALVTDA